MEETLYFAYGSNINLEQMAHRCPDAQIVGPVTLENYELQFRGSGFATVAPKKSSVVHGLLWKLTPESERALDRYEGYPRHYTKEQVSVRTADGAAVSVMAYVMQNQCAASLHCRPHTIIARSNKASRPTACQWNRWRKRGIEPSTRCGAAKWTGPKRGIK